MSSPYPTVADYLDFAGANGCSITSEVICGPGHEIYNVALVGHPNGRFVRAIFVERTEVLMSSTVAHLDRRLGLKSYFFV